MGFPVIRRWSRDTVRIRVPRCAACRSRSRTGIAMVLGAALIGGIAATVLQRWFWPQAAPPAWMHYTQSGIGSFVTGPGLVLGFVLALLAVALRNRRLGIRSVMTYPPVVQLRRIGWQFPANTHGG